MLRLRLLGPSSARLPRTLTGVLLMPLLALTLTGPSALAAPSYDRGLSQPREDSVYPGQGDPGVDVLHYGLNLTWRRASRTLEGRATLAVRATRTAASLTLDLGRSLRVDDVTADGVPVRFRHRGTHLRVLLPVRRDQRVTLVVRYHGTPRPVPAPSTRGDVQGLGMHVSRDGQLWTMQEPWGALTWYPVNDHPSDKALYDMRVSVPRQWVGVAGGRMVRRVVRDGRTVTRWHLSHPTASYLTTLAVGPYRRTQLRGPHRLPITIWGPREDTSYLHPLHHMPHDLAWLEDRLGRYPFAHAGVVLTPSSSAMETQELITYGLRTFRHGDVRSTVVHELAHQWFGDAVTPDDWRDLWLNEGHAMYLEARWSAAHTKRTWRSWRHTLTADDQLWRDIYGPPGAYDPDRFASINVYYCPARMLIRLEDRFGERTFRRVLRAWPARHRDESVGRAAYTRIWEGETGAELSEFFRTWLNSPTSPR